MKTYDEAFAAAKDRRPFSNGSQGGAWTANWCDRCVHDRSARRDDVKPDPANKGLLGCALLAVALMERTPAEWIDQCEGGHRLGDTYHCTEFRDENGRGDEPEPEPPPVIEGQVDMFEVFADQIVEQASERAGVSV